MWHRSWYLSLPGLISAVSSCDDRPDFTKPELFPGVEETHLVDFARLNDYVKITEDDFVCIMTRGHANDRLAQAQALKTPAAYIV